MGCLCCKRGYADEEEREPLLEASCEKNDPQLATPAHDATKTDSTTKQFEALEGYDPGLSTAVRVVTKPESKSVFQRQHTGTPQQEDTASGLATKQFGVSQEDLISASPPRKELSPPRKEPPPSKKKPPPIAPKPKPSRTLSSDDTVTYEPSSSFEDPSLKGEPLQPLESRFRRPSGPKGRNLPSRYRKQQDLF